MTLFISALASKRNEIRTSRLLHYFGNFLSFNFMCENVKNFQISTGVSIAESRIVNKSQCTLF